jgi:hypothetical protein
LGSADAELSLGTIYQYLEGVPHNVTNIGIELPSDKFRQAPSSATNKNEAKSYKEIKQVNLRFGAGKAIRTPAP